MCGADPGEGAPDYNNVLHFLGGEVWRRWCWVEVVCGEKVECRNNKGMDQADDGGHEGSKRSDRVNFEVSCLFLYVEEVRCSSNIRASRDDRPVGSRYGRPIPFD
jgi:hypothetical protein